jgi:hypothetical protein
MSGIVVDSPGLYDIPESAYHADPVPGGSMSSTQARHILSPGCPAIVDYERTHPTHRDVFDVGTAAHKLVLGKGGELREIPADDWRGKPAKEARDQARAEGATALLSKDMRAVEAMAGAVLQHPTAGRLFTPGGFLPERSIFWQTDGVWCRAMCDALILDSVRPLVVDLKTAPSVDLPHIRKAIANFGYHQQAAHYLEGVESLGFDEVGFLFVFVAKEPPHLVRVVELDYAALTEGAHLNAKARDLFATCQAAGNWPGYPEDISLITLPPWAYSTEDES